MELISNFYNTLFAIELAVYLAIASIIIIFIQITYSQYSYREINLLFKSSILIISTIMSIVTLSFTGYTSLTISFSDQSFFNFDLIKNKNIASINFSTFITSLILFLMYIAVNIKYLRPSRIALMISKKIKPKMIMYFILKKFGLPKPPVIESEFSAYNNDEIDDMINIYSKNSIDTSDGMKLKEYEIKKNQFNEDMQRTQKKYQSLLYKIKQASDPLEPLHALAIRAINNHDFKTLDDIKLLLINISNEFFITYYKISSNAVWNPYDRLTTKYIKHLLEMLDIYLDIFDTLSFYYGKIKILEISNSIIIELLNYECATKEIEILLNLWKDQADRSIAKSSKLFIYIFKFYHDLLDRLFNDFYGSQDDIIDIIFRHIGWLGERLLSLKQIEQKPYMYDSDYSNEYDQLINILCRSSEHYMKYSAKEYPLIFFDAVRVVFTKYIHLFTQDTLKNDDIYVYIDIFSSFAKEAVKKGNMKGASLAILKLKCSYEDLTKMKFDECAKLIIANFIEICGLYLIHKGTMQGANVLSERIDKYLIKIVEACPYEDTIASTLREFYIRSGDNMNVIWDFITILGKQMQTNFGMMFDWQTGLRYSDDDPRRK